MIKKVEMFQAVCDRCGKTHFATMSHTSTFATQGQAKRSAMNYDWLNINGKLYCPDCVVWDRKTKSYKPKERSEQ